MLFRSNDTATTEIYTVMNILSLHDALPIYALGLIANSAEILLLNLRAWQLREPLRLNARERLMTRGELTGWSIPVSVGIVSLVFSFTLPIEQIAWCGWVYFLMAILIRMHKFWHRRQLRAVPGSGIISPSEPAEGAETNWRTRVTPQEGEGNFRRPWR